MRRTTCSAERERERDVASTAAWASAGLGCRSGGSEVPAYSTVAVAVCGILLPSCCCLLLAYCDYFRSLIKSTKYIIESTNTILSRYVIARYECDYIPATQENRVLLV